MDRAPSDTTSLRLGGPRVLLRPHAPADAGPAFELLEGEERILSWLTWTGPESVRELAEHYRTWRVPSGLGDDYRLAIVERDQGRLVGSIALRFTGHRGVGDLGYWLGVPFQGRGFGTEAVILAAHLAFRHLGAHGLFAWVFDGNVASLRVLEKNAFQRVRSRNVRLIGGGTREEHHLSCLATDWEAAYAEWRPEVEEISGLDA